MSAERILITGGSRGIGRACAMRLASRGRRIALTYRSDRASAQRTADAVRDAGAEAWLIHADISSARQSRDLVGRVARRWGGVDIFVSNAGIAETKPIAAISEHDWARIMDVNLRGAFFCAREALRVMRTQRRGAIVLIGSQAGATGGFLIGAHYSLSKAGLPVLAKILAREGAPFGVRANCVAPGLIDTDLSRRFPAKAAKDLVDKIPLGRKGTTEEVADAVAFLAERTATYITGITLPITGGLWMP